MGRPVKLTDDQATPLGWVWDVVYNAVGQLTSMTYWTGQTPLYDYYTETRTYNGTAAVDPAEKGLFFPGVFGRNPAGLTAKSVFVRQPDLY